MVRPTARPALPAREFAATCLAVGQLALAVVGSLWLPGLFAEAFAGGGHALAAVAAWWLPPMLSIGLRKVATDTYSPLWWVAWGLLLVATGATSLLMVLLYGVGRAIAEHGLIT